MLKEDLLLTIFACNTNKQKSKRKASVLREEAATKKKLCNDVFMHNESVQILNLRLTLKQPKNFKVTNKWRHFPPKRNLTLPTHANSAHNVISNTYNVISSNLKLRTMKTWRLNVTKKPVKKMSRAYQIKVKLNNPVTTKVQVFPLHQS